MENYAFSDQEYGKVLDNFVIGCVDVAIVYGNLLLLEQRTNDPIRGEWWIFGGRMQRGESFVVAARRSVSRELGLIIDLKRFFEVGTYNLMWVLRREPEASNGCQHLLVAHAVRVSKVEYARINEYVMRHGITAKWLSYDDIRRGAYLKEIKDISFRLLK